MKIARMSIILGTLALAGLLGGKEEGVMRSAACSVDGVASALMGTPAVGSCQR